MRHDHTASTPDDLTTRLQVRLWRLFSDAYDLADDRARRECGMSLAAVGLKRRIDQHEACNGNWRRLHHLRYNPARQCWTPYAQDGALLFEPLWRLLPAEQRPRREDFDAVFHEWRFRDDRGPLRRGWDISRLKRVWAGGMPGDDKLWLDGSGDFERDYSERLARLVDATGNPVWYARLLAAAIDYAVWLAAAGGEQAPATAN